MAYAGQNLEGFSEEVTFKLGLEVWGNYREKPEGSPGGRKDSSS